MRTDPFKIVRKLKDKQYYSLVAFAEQGYPNTDASSWYGLLAPAKTPPAVIARLNKAVNDALADASVHEKLVNAGATPAGGTPDSFGAFLKAEYERWGKIVKDRGIKDPGQ